MKKLLWALLRLGLYFVLSILLLMVLEQKLNMSYEAALACAIAAFVLLNALWIAAAAARLRRRKSAPQGKGGDVAHRGSAKRVLAVICIIIAAAGVLAYYLSIPRALIEQAKKYPEMRSFAYMYPLECNMPHNRDISRELDGGIPLFIQWDRRWGYESYGSGILAVTGCGPTCLAMVASGLTENAEYDPYTVAQMAEENGYYVDGQGSSWTLMTEGAARLGLKATRGEVSADYIRDNLSGRGPIICSVISGDFTTQGHFIVLTDIDAFGNVTVHDPNSKLNSAKTWPVERLIPQIAALWVYELT